MIKQIKTTNKNKQKHAYLAVLWNLREYFFLVVVKIKNNKFCIFYSVSASNCTDKFHVRTLNTPHHTSCKTTGYQFNSVYYISSHLQQGITSWLLYRGGLLIQCNLYIVVTLGTQPVGCYTEVACLYSGTCI